MDDQGAERIFSVFWTKQRKIICSVGLTLLAAVLLLWSGTPWSALAALSMAVSAVFNYAPYLREISAGMRVILLTVALSVAAALIRPVKEEEAA